MKKILNNRIFQLAIILLAGLFLGWLIFTPPHQHEENHSHEHAEDVIYTCSMHPQIRQSEPGKCPICGMDLIPLVQTSDKGESSPFIHTMSANAIALADVQTQKVKFALPEHEIHLTGKVALNEQGLAVITSNYSGRMENLYVDFKGQNVSKGQKLASIYSPELITAQQELIEAAKIKESNGALYDAAKEKLRLWKISEEQIAEIEEGGSLIREFSVYADRSGVVIKRDVAKGDYVNKGSVLMEIADLSKLWVLLDAYESDLQFLKPGKEVSFTASSLPGREFTSTISFIDPIINPQSRTASVRVELTNPDRVLKPEMFVRAKVKAATSPGEKSLLIPNTALLWTGKRSIVYVKVPDSEFPSFEMREIGLGASLGEYYIVESGLSEGEEVVSNGLFAIDASAQLAGKSSMMNPEGVTGVTAHSHAEEHGEKTKEIESLPIDRGAKGALQSLYSAYLKLKDALVSDDFVTAQKEAVNMTVVLDKIDMHLFGGEAHDAWMKFHESLDKSLEHAHHYSDIEQLRKAFQSLSTTMIEMTLTFKPLDKIIYVQYCPMADNNKGADWLSTEKEIRNPYFGSSMLSCGDVIREIK